VDYSWHHRRSRGCVTRALEAIHATWPAKFIDSPISLTDVALLARLFLAMATERGWAMMASSKVIQSWGNGP
jgi:hypothetical protein